MSNKDFGEYIKKLRTVKGLNISETAKLTGISQPYLSQMERGERKAPSNKMIQRLAKALEVNYYDLLAKAGHITEEEAQESKIKLSQAQTDFSNISGFNLDDILLDIRPTFLNGRELTHQEREQLLKIAKIITEPKKE